MGKFDLDDILNDSFETEQAMAEGPSTPAATPTGSASPAAVMTSQAIIVTDAHEADPEDGAMDLYREGKVGKNDIGMILLSRDVINAEQLTSAKRVVKASPGKRISKTLVEMGVAEELIQEAVADVARIPFERIDAESEDAYDRKGLHKLGADFCKENLVLPLRRVGARLVIGTANPDDLFLLDKVKRMLGEASVKHVLVPGTDILALLEHLQEDNPNAEDEVTLDEILADVDEDDVEVVRQEEDDADISDAESSPVVRYVNHIIQTALKEGASDIHVEPDEKTLKVRFRIDGVLFEMMNPPKKMHAALTSRLKIMANLDIAERRLPQDGRIRVTVLGRKLDLRMSTIPTPKGEKTVMRILDNRSIQVSLDQLGFAPDTLTLWKNQIKQPHGIILVTGPTGSGKTTTLYSSIRQMDLAKLNVSTVEDPIEYNLSNITQIQTHERIGMNFAKALKALLRQDPDVIMVGEIRDLETATTAIQASLTGHLVLSTLHTNDAPSSITRLINIGTEAFLVGAAVNSVLAQRLVRKICANCEQEMLPAPEVQDFLTMHGIHVDKVKHGVGCQKCRQIGYAGRSGIYEILLVDDFLRDRIAGSPNVSEFRRVCKERGMISLRDDGFKKVEEGVTTVEEIMRVTESTI